MSDIETPFKAKLRSHYWLRTEFEKDEDLFEAVKLYMGNPFNQPSTISARSNHHPKVS